MNGRFIIALFLCSAAFAGESATDIVKRSLELYRRIQERAKDYTYQSCETLREIDPEGKVKSSKSHTYDVLIIDGRRYRQLIAEDGKPLKKPQEPKQFHDSDKDRANFQKLVSEIPAAYNFRLLRDEAVSGKLAWVLQAEPNPAYQPRDSRARMFSKIRGKIWIDKSEYHWVKVEAETTDTISFGLFLARLAPGASLRFEQTRVNGEVWLPSHTEIDMKGRLALIKKLHGVFDITYSDYRKFQTDSKVVSTEALP